MPQKKEQTKAITIREYMRTDTVLQGFADLMGEANARAYISSVLITVGNDEKLMKCELKSIYNSALRAASLQLSVDMAANQAYLVPFAGKCTLLVSYKGLLDLAVRTGQYKWINVDKVYEGEEWVMDRLSGIHTLEGEKTSEKIIGWFAAFEMVNGYVKTHYMSLKEIHDHAKRYSKNYKSAKSLWKTNPQVMERKTPLRILLTQWGYIAPNDQTALMAIESDDWINGEYKEIEAGVEAEVAEKKRKPRKSAKKSGEQLGYDMDKNPTTAEKKASEPWPQEAINAVLDNTALTTGDDANRLLELSGLSRKRASISGIKSFAKWYQSGLDQDIKDAVQYAKDNFGNGEQ